jgi:hypothetical protein
MSLNKGGNTAPATMVVSKVRATHTIAPMYYGGEGKVNPPHAMQPRAEAEAPAPMTGKKRRKFLTGTGIQGVSRDEVKEYCSREGMTVQLVKQKYPGLLVPKTTVYDWLHKPHHPEPNGTVYKKRRIMTKEHLHELAAMAEGDDHFPIDCGSRRRCLWCRASGMPDKKSKYKCEGCSKDGTVRYLHPKCFKPFHAYLRARNTA